MIDGFEIGWGRLVCWWFDDVLILMNWFFVLRIDGNRSVFLCVEAVAGVVDFGPPCVFAGTGFYSKEIRVMVC